MSIEHFPARGHLEVSEGMFPTVVRSLLKSSLLDKQNAGLHESFKYKIVLFFCSVEFHFFFLFSCLNFRLTVLGENLHKDRTSDCHFVTFMHVGSDEKYMEMLVSN